MEMSVQSVKRWIPAANVIKVTESPFYSQPFMLADLGIIATELLNPSRLPALFLDTDIIVRDDIHLDGEWDFCVTWRDNMGDLSKLMPYNFGIWWAHHTPESRWAAMWMYERALKLSPDHQKWYGNQIAMRELLGPPIPHGIKEVKLSCGMTLKVKMLPGEVYNFTPEKIEDVSTRKVIHLKGNRKDLMEHYTAEALRGDSKDHKPA
jgi:hypothetical protein